MAITPDDPAHPAHGSLRDGATAWHDFNKLYPYVVFLVEVIDEDRGIESHDIDRAMDWILQNKIIDMAWGYRMSAIYFSRKEDAILFKMGTWLNA